MGAGRWLCSPRPAHWGSRESSTRHPGDCGLPGAWAKGGKSHLLPAPGGKSHLLPASGHAISRWLLPLHVNPASGLQAGSLSAWRSGERAATVHWWYRWAWWRRDVRAWIRSRAAGRGLAGTGGSSEQHRRVPHLFNSCRNSKELFCTLSEPSSSSCLLKGWGVQAWCSTGTEKRSRVVLWTLLKKQAEVLSWWLGVFWVLQGNFQDLVSCSPPNRSKSSAWIQTPPFIFQSITETRSFFTNPFCLQMKASTSVTVEVLLPFASALPTALACNGCYFYPL